MQRGPRPVGERAEEHQEEQEEKRSKDASARVVGGLAEEGQSEGENESEDEAGRQHAAWMTGDAMTYRGAGYQKARRERLARGGLCLRCRWRAQKGRKHCADCMAERREEQQR